MFRNTLLALAATAGLIGGTELTGSSAKADGIIGVRVGPVGVVIGGPRYPVYRPVYVPPPVVVAPVCCQYSVYYRGCPAEPWRLYGTFATSHRARATMGGLQVQGFEVYETAR